MDEAGRRIVDKVWRGALPADEPVKTWGGRSSSLKCDDCDVPILPSESELESDMPGPSQETTKGASQLAPVMGFCP